METWEVSVLAAVAVLAVLLGAHSLTRLGRQLRLWRQEGIDKPWGRALGEGLVFAVIWAMGAAIAVLVSFPAQESETAGAAGALLTILGAFGIGSYAFALALVTVVGFFRLGPDGAGAPWLRHALVTGLTVSATWVLLCPSPLLLVGEAQPSAPHLAGLLGGVVIYSIAVVTGVFGRARRPLPAADSEGREHGTPKPGIVALALLLLLWPPWVPAAALALYDRIRHVDPAARGFSALEWPGVVLWLVPVATIAGLHLRRAWGRRLALGVCGIAALVFCAATVPLVRDGDLVWVLSLIPIALFAWPLWYLTRPAIRKLFSDKEKDTNRT